MARAIDTEVAKKRLQVWIDESDAHGFDREVTCFQDCISLLDAVPTLTLPNEPLTLGQLRKMDGEPVYIIIDGVEPLKMWVLIEVDGEDIYLTNNLGGRSYYEEAMELYKFKLYRRPPEGEEDT